MTTIIMALLSGYLSTQQAAELSMVCTAEAPTTDQISFKCCLKHKDVDLQCEATNLIKTDKVPVSDLATMWCGGTLASMSFPQGTSS